MWTGKHLSCSFPLYSRLSRKFKRILPHAYLRQRLEEVHNRHTMRLHFNNQMTVRIDMCLRFRTCPYLQGVLRLNSLTFFFPPLGHAIGGTMVCTLYLSKVSRRAFSAALNMLATSQLDRPRNLCLISLKSPLHT